SIRGTGIFVQAVLQGFQNKVRNLRGAAVAHGQYDRADAAADVNLRCTERIVADFEAHPSFGAAINATDQRQLHLTAVRVAGQDQIDSHVRGFVDDARIMREQHGGRVIRNTAHRAAQIGAVEQVVHTRQIDFLPVAAEFDVPVAQHFDSVAVERLRDFVGANAKIMVPQHRKYSRARTKPAEHLRYWLNIIARPGYKVPRHGNQIGLELVGKLDDCS